MARFLAVASVVLVFLSLNQPQSTDAQEVGQRLFQPLKKLREKRMERQGKVEEKKEGKAKEKELEAKRTEVEQKELEVKEKELALKERELKEEMEEKDKPWDVADGDPENELLMMAGKAKSEEELAPKKIEALNYLATLGCAKDENVTAAIMAGLMDGNTGVRRAAVNAVISAYSGSAPNVTSNAFPVSDPYQMPAGHGLMQPYSVMAPQPAGHVGCQSCGRRGNHNFVVNEGCRSCGGHGCEGCNFSGQLAQVYTEPCQACATGSVANLDQLCISCCDPKVIDELKKMANDEHPKIADCHYEPSSQVRQLAAQALLLCPVKPKNKNLADNEEPATEPIFEQPGDGDEDKSENNPEEMLPEDDSGDSDDETDSEDANDPLDVLFDARKNPTPFRSANPTPFRSVSFSATKSTFLNAYVKGRSNNYLGGLSIELSDEYHIPKDSLVYLQIATGESFFADVVQSKLGEMTVVFNDSGINSFGQGDEIQFGVVDTSTGQ